MKSALIIVDPQEDFIEPQDKKIIEALWVLAQKADIVIATQSVHPANHVSFTELGPHCVQGSKGRKLHKGLEEYIDIATSKVGVKEHYSAFDSETLRPKESLEEILRIEDVGEIWIAGFGHEWDVPQSAFDANALGYPTTVYAKATKKLNKKAIEKLERAGVHVVRD